MTNWQRSSAIAKSWRDGRHTHNTHPQLHSHSLRIALLLSSRGSVLNSVNQNISNKMWYYRVLLCTRVFHFLHRCVWLLFLFLFCIFSFDLATLISVANRQSVRRVLFSSPIGTWVCVCVKESGFNQLQFASRALSPLPPKCSPKKRYIYAINAY